VTTEYLTIEQFAARLQLSRSTAYNWIAQGRLISGQHVLHVGGVIRILWGDELLAHLLELSKRSEPVERPVLKREGKGGRNKIAFDRNSLGGNALTVV
jgi:excisionase family DNA binding protein